MLQKNCSRCLRINPVIKSAASAASPMTKTQGSPPPLLSALQLAADLSTGLIFELLEQNLAKPIKLLNGKYVPEEACSHCACRDKSEDQRQPIFTAGRRGKNYWTICRISARACFTSSWSKRIWDVTSWLRFSHFICEMCSSES